MKGGVKLGLFRRSECRTVGVSDVDLEFNREDRRLGQLELLR